MCEAIGFAIIIYCTSSEFNGMKSLVPDLDADASLSLEKLMLSPDLIVSAEACDVMTMINRKVDNLNINVPSQN